MNDTDMKSAEPEKPKSKRKWGKVILTLSLALNLLIIGAVIGSGWMRHRGGGDWKSSRDFFMNRMMSDVPSEKQQSIRTLLTNNRQTQKITYRKIRTQYKEFRQVLRGDPFDADKLRQAANGLHTARGELVTQKTDLIVKVLEQLTPAERQDVLDNRFFRRLLSPGGRPPHKRHWKFKRRD